MNLIDKITGGRGKPDSDMKMVLAELAMKGGKPIESLSAEEARMQPTPTDAVKEVLKNINRGQQPEKKNKLAEVRDIEVQGAAGKIAARLYIPVGQKPL